MTNQQPPITPPEDLLQQLRHNMGTWLDQITIAYQAGADQELEACLWHLESTRCNQIVITTLRNTRRPKPPSLKKQALNDLDTIQTHDSFGFQIIDLSNIRRAVEALNDWTRKLLQVDGNLSTCLLQNMWRKSNFCIVRIPI